MTYPRIVYAKPSELLAVYGPCRCGGRPHALVQFSDAQMAWCERCIEACESLRSAVRL